MSAYARLIFAVIDEDFSSVKDPYYRSRPRQRFDPQLFLQARPYFLRKRILLISFKFITNITP